MAVDESNVLRVDLEDIINEARHRTELKSRSIQDDAMAQKIAMSDDDYTILTSWILECAGIIGNEANYIWHPSQTGLDSISNPYTEQDPNPNDAFDVTDLNTLQKQSSELMPKNIPDFLVFNMPQLEGALIYKYTIIQTMIRSAMIEYLLAKWYNDCGLMQDSQIAGMAFNNWKSQVRFNAVTSQKNLKTPRMYRAY